MGSDGMGWEETFVVGDSDSEDEIGTETVRKQTMGMCLG